ncbi:DUF4381 domain-containing protein [Pseudidiomarina halophila]|uniref:Uncharacterized protein n=2 Tax=Pseudidiomarina halophila TaxID=1449799 RepID=A0A432XT94_9GAMM|nr:DUF4381 domain-containing protein [Pseudidiomarina halophila]RUO51947.1 hypothetical protein CWI69_09915 [Pseudidiomarina halophila]
MIRSVVLGLALLILQSAAAQPFSRTLWYEVDVTRHGASHVRLEVAPSEWWRLRVYHNTDETASQTPQVWSSEGDGVFISHDPLDAHSEDDFTDYFYHLQTPAERIVLLETTDAEQVAMQFYRSETEAMPEHTRDARIKLSDAHDTSTLTRESGFESHDFQFIHADTNYTIEFAEPGLYHLEVKLPWDASYQLREVLTMAAESAGFASPKSFQLEAQLDTTTRYNDTLSQGTQLLSRSILLPFYVVEAEQQIAIDLDRNAYLRWLETDPERQFLFQRNAPRPVDQAEQKQSALEPYPLVTTSFFRSLPPNQTLQTDVFVPLTGNMREDQETFLPIPREATREVDYFYQLPATRSAIFELPKQTQQAPVRVMLKWPNQPASLTIRSSGGEQQQIRYLPEFAVNERWQLDNASQLASATNTEQPSHRVTELVLPFHKPYSSITVQNTGEHEAWLRLDYQVERREPPTETTWLDLSPAEHALLLEALLSGEAEPLAENALKHEVMEQWRPRLNARANQFAQRYASEYLTQKKGLGMAEFAAIKASLAATFPAQLNTIEDVYTHIMELGYNFTARQLLVDFAVSPESALQREAEAVLLHYFIEQERWFDVEGYWAWRMLQRNDEQALVEIARSWAHQNRYHEAAQLFWLLNQSGAVTGVDAEALRAAWESDQFALFQEWFLQLPGPTQVAWPRVIYENAALGGAYSWVKRPVELDGMTRQALIYNQDLNQYLSTFYLQDSAPVSTRISNSPRLKLTLYPVLKDLPTGTEPVREVTVTVNQKTYPLVIRQDRSSDSLSWSQHDGRYVGLPQSYTLELDAGQPNSITVQTKGFDAGIVIETAEPFLHSELTDDSSAVSQHSRPPAATPDLTLRLAELLLEHQQGPVDASELKRIKAETLGTVLTDEQHYLLDQLTSGYGWQRLDTVSASDGIAFLETARWQPSSPWLQLRRALMLTDVKPGERRLADDEKAEIAVELRDAMKLELQIRKIEEITAPAMPVSVSIDAPTGQRTLELNGQQQSVSLELAAGRHLIGLAFTEPSPALVLYRLVDQNGNPVTPPTQIKTFRASQQQNIELFIPAKSLIRIDHYEGRDDNASQSYQWFAEDTFYKVAHRGDSEHSYYRFFIWQPQSLPSGAEAVTTEQVAISRAAEKPPTIWPVDAQHGVYADTRYALDEQDDGTWGFDLGYRARNNFDEDIRDEQEKFIDARWNYLRKLEDLDAYWNSSVQWRAHNGTGLHTLISDNQAYWLANKYFDAEANLNIYYQASARDSGVEGAWSAYASLSGRWKYFWNNRARNDVELQVFGRELSEQQLPATAIDDDILTQYKLDHRYGVTLRDRFFYQPWLDSRVHVEAELTLNEFGQNQLLDHWSVESGWRQYWKPWRFGFDLRYTRYLEDDNRVRGLSSTQVGLNLDYELWQSNGNLWQFSFDVRHDIIRNSTGAFFGISWNHTDGQGYDDFAPQNRIFSSLRQRHSLEMIDTNDITLNDHREPADEN